jgi:hypothetical protein
MAAAVYWDTTIALSCSTSAQSIELALKAYALKKRFPYEQLHWRDMGHERTSVAKKVMELGYPTFDELSMHLMGTLEANYAGRKKLQYPSLECFAVLPGMLAARQIADEIIARVYPEIWNKQLYESEKGSPNPHKRFGLNIEEGAIYGGPSVEELRAELAKKPKDPGST